MSPVSKTGVRGVVIAGSHFRAMARSAGVLHYAGTFATLAEAEAAAVALRNRLMTNNLLDREPS